MFLKIKNKSVNLDLLGKTKQDVLIFMEGEPVQISNNVWCYTLDASHLLQNTVLFIEFEDNKACFLSTTIMYKNPLKKIMVRGK